MSKKIDEVRQEKANAENMLKNYQKKKEELKAEETLLLKEMETTRPYDWKDQTSEEPEKYEDYIVADPQAVISRTLNPQETNFEKIERLRNEILRKQFENMKLEKELEAQRNEHKEFHRRMEERKESLVCQDAPCPDRIEPSDFYKRGVGWRTGTNGSSETTNRSDEEVWEEMGRRFDE